MTTSDWPDLDPQLRAWQLEAPAAPPDSTPDVMREYSQRNNSIAYARLMPSLPAVSVRDATADGPSGPVPVRIYAPSGAVGDGGPVPLVVYFHGGGWVVGSLDTHRAQAHRLCVQVGAVVVSVGYRLAPEHRFPAAYDDCAAVTEWAAANAAGLGADPGRLVTAGDSAGGQLAASVAIEWRDAGRPLAGQLLIYPVIAVDGRYQDALVNALYPSRGGPAVGPGLTVEGMEFFATSYVSVEESGDWRVSPLAADLHGVAPAVVHLARLDPLRDEGHRYAEVLREAGVEVITREFPTLNHGYFGLSGVSVAADQAARQAAADLRQLLGLAPLSLS